MIEPLDALLESVRAGTAALVVVEGETKNDDPKIYGRWFGHLARDLSFVHQDGYRRVQKAVAYLREHAPGRPVFGLIDRDFTSRDETDVDAELERGLFRTGWYTLENYFFADTAAWAQVVELLTDEAPRAGEPPRRSGPTSTPPIAAPCRSQPTIGSSATNAGDRPEPASASITRSTLRPSTRTPCAS